MKRTIQLVFLTIFVLFLFAMPLHTLLGPHSAASFYEQRALAPLPELSGQTLWSGQFFTDLETALTDHIAFRDRILKADTRMNLALGRVKVNNLVVNSTVLLDCYGFSHWKLDYLAGQAAEQADRYAALRDKISAYGGYFCYLGLPQQSSYFAEQYPPYMDSRLWHANGMRDAFSAAMAERSVPFVNMYGVYQAQGKPAEYYFETDHHFTYRGAFAAYETLLEKLARETDFGIEARTAADFNWTRLPNPFLGSANRKLYGLRESGDFLETASLKTEIPFTREDNGEPVEARVFALPEDAEQDVTYSLYMGGDVGETLLKTGREELPSLLIYGDSFTNPLETLLWADFDETRCLDLRYYDKKTLEAYIDTYRPDVVLCVRDESVFLSAEGNGA